MIARAIVALVILLIAVATYPGAVLTSLATRLNPAPNASPGPQGALSWLHVAHPAGESPYIADDQGRIVVLHGATPASLLEFGPGTEPLYPIDPAAYEDGRCPPNLGQSRYPALCRDDLEAMSALGFNLVRLPISWSVLEPERGRFNTTLLDRIAQIVDWARSLRMYVIVDMHQNAYSHYVSAGAKGSDVDLRYNSGAPRWATITDGFPSFVVRHQRELNPAVFEATTNFWYNREGIQDEYIAALAAIARGFANDSVVAGYGVYNEPWLGWNLPPGFEDLLLFPFYRRAIDAITGVRDGLPCWSGFFMPAACGYRDLGVHDQRHLMFLDTGLLREVTDFPTHLGLPISSYPNVVLGLHAYTHIYTPDALLGQKVPNTSYPWGAYDQGWDFAVREARAMDAALFVEEFGNDPGDDPLILANQLREAERHRVGFAFWTWKENGDAHSWGMFDPPASPTASSGCLRGQRELMLASIYPRATSDQGLTYHYDSFDGGFTLIAHGNAGQRSTLVYVPPEATGSISSQGAVRVDVSDERDGSRVVSASPTGGEFGITVSPAPFRLAGCG